MPHTLYEQDFHAWTQTQGKALRDGRLNDLDIENLAEEIESMGRQERRELRNRLKALLVHLLKWEFTPAKRSNSWISTVMEQRKEAQCLLKENPSLGPMLPGILAEAYDFAVIGASRETGLPIGHFPELCPFGMDEVFEREVRLDQE